MNQGPARSKGSPSYSPLVIARRAVVTIFGILGAAANLLGIYAFGEDHGWWEYEFALSLDAKEALLMGLVGVGGPWALIVGGVIGARITELATKDRRATWSLIHSFIQVGFFFAILHAAQMSVGLRIFPDHLSPEGFLKVVGIYLLTGLWVGVVLPLIVHGLRKASSHRKQGRPTPRWSGRKPRKTRFRRSP